jgi:hypothetical protein
MRKELMKERTKKYCNICKKRIHYPQMKYCKRCAFEVFKEKGNIKAYKKYLLKEKSYKNMNPDEQRKELFKFAHDYLERLNSNQDILTALDLANARLQERIIRMNYKTRVFYGLPKKYDDIYGLPKNKTGKE